MSELDDKTRFLAGLPVFRGLTRGEVAEVAALLKGVAVVPGELLCQEGDPGDSVFLLTRGEVQVLKRTAHGDDQTLATIAAPSVIGEMALIDGAPRSASVRVGAGAGLYRIDCADFNELRYGWSTAASKVVRNLAVTLCERLRDTNGRINSFFADPERALASLRVRQRELLEQRLRQREGGG